MNSFLMGPSDYSGLHPADALSLVSDARRVGRKHPTPILAV